MTTDWLEDQGTEHPCIWSKTGPTHMVVITRGADADGDVYEWRIQCRPLFSKPGDDGRALATGRAGSLPQAKADADAVLLASMI